MSGFAHFSAALLLSWLFCAVVIVGVTVYVAVYEKRHPDQHMHNGLAWDDDED